MWEIFGRLISGLIPSAIKSLTVRTRLKIICGWGHEPNVNRVGNYLAMWVKIINPTSSPMYFERIEVVNQAGEVFFPSFYHVKTGDEIPVQKNIVGLIPCGHMTSVKPTELRIYDSTERKHTVKGRAFRKVVEEITTERARLEQFHLCVHPSRPYPE